MTALFWWGLREDYFKRYFLPFRNSWITQTKTVLYGCRPVMQRVMVRYRLEKRRCLRRQRLAAGHTLGGISGRKPHGYRPSVRRRAGLDFCQDFCQDKSGRPAGDGSGGSRNRAGLCIIYSSFKLRQPHSSRLIA